MGGRKIGGIVALAGGGALVVSGAIFAGLGAMQKSSIKNGNFATENDIQGAANTGTTYDRLSISFFVIGGVAAVAGIVLVATAPKSAPEQVDLTVAPVALPGGGGVALSGRLP